VVGVQERGDGAGADRFGDLQLPLHACQMGGLPGRILVCLTGGAAVVLGLTGVFVWWRKRAARAGRAYSVRSSKQRVWPKGASPSSSLKRQR